MSLLQQLEKRWDARQSGMEPLTVTASTRIDRPGDEVWEFLLAPQSALLTGTNVIKSFRVPGTPVGAVGEQQCIIMSISGRLAAHISEVVALDAPHRLVTRWPTMPTEMLATLQLSPDGTGTLLTHQIGLRIAAGSRKKQEPTILASMEEELERIRQGVESGTRFSEEIQPSLD